MNVVLKHFGGKNKKVVKRRKPKRVKRKSAVPILSVAASRHKRNLSIVRRAAHKARKPHLI